MSSLKNEYPFRVIAKDKEGALITTVAKFCHKHPHIDQVIHLEEDMAKRYGTSVIIVNMYRITL